MKSSNEKRADLSINQKGFTVLEMMIAAGVMLVIFAAITSQITSMQRESKRLVQKMATVDMSQSLRRTLSRRKNCEYNIAFGGLPLPKHLNRPPFLLWEAQIPYLRKNFSASI